MCARSAHKLVYNRTQVSELYDLREDPHELRNLIDMPEAEAIKKELLERMREHMVRLEDPILSWFERMRDVI